VLRYFPSLYVAATVVGGLARAQPADQRVTFQEAIRRALEQNPSAQVAQEEIRRASALMEQARSGSLPTLFGTGTYTRLDSARPLTTGATYGPNAVNANLLLSVPLIAPKQWAQWAHAEDSVDVAQANATDVRRQVAIAAGRSYLTVLLQRRVLEAAVLARDTAKAHFDFSVARTVGGIGSELDQVRAEREMEADEVLVQTAQSSLVAAREALSVLVAAPEPIEPSETVDLGATPSLGQALDQAASLRSDVLLAKSQVLASLHRVRDDWTDYSPYLTGVAEPMYNNPPLQPLDPGQGWQATISLVFPFYDGGLRYGQAKERDALLAEARFQLDGALRQARSDVRAAHSALELAGKGLVASRKAANRAHRALDLANIAYRNGATTNIEVIDAEREARDADTAVALSEDTERQARLDLLAACGSFP
jgi:outer membrane protein